MNVDILNGECHVTSDGRTRGAEILNNYVKIHIPYNKGERGIRKHSATIEKMKLARSKQIMPNGRNAYCFSRKLIDDSIAKRTATRRRNSKLRGKW
jgi:hypothetical protein